MKFAFTVQRARYAKCMLLVTVSSPPKKAGETRFKNRVERLIDYLRGRYTHRERGFILTPTKVERLRRLYRAGYDATFVTAKLLDPDGRECVEPKGRST